ncbi:MAG TPA: hypothetical protein VJO53_06030 [Candidatus Acidoferrales bacterium]|nr:hypothetical protein [Candidatus Acidoferrales bacterium]
MRSPPYNRSMARGWESKSVEGQVEDSQTKGRGKDGVPLTPEQNEARRRREVLLLSRARVQGDLQSSRDQRYRDQLSRALADIEAQIAALERSM